jgi:hypothetical protein
MHEYQKRGYTPKVKPGPHCRACSLPSSACRVLCKNPSATHTLQRRTGNGGDMRHLLNTLFVLTEDSYLALEGENVVVLQGDETLGRFPLHTLQGILYFGYKGASPALMGACAKSMRSPCAF